MYIPQFCTTFSLIHICHHMLLELMGNKTDLWLPLAFSSVHTHACTHTHTQCHAHMCTCAHTHTHARTHARTHTHTQCQHGPNILHTINLLNTQIAEGTKEGLEWLLLVNVDHSLSLCLKFVYYQSQSKRNAQNHWKPLQGQLESPTPSSSRPTKIFYATTNSLLHQ